MKPQIKFKLATIIAPAAMLGALVTLVGPKAVINVGASRTENQIILVATVPQDRIVDDKLINLPDGATLDKIKAIEGNEVTTVLDITNYAYVGSIERGNRRFAIVADAQFANSPAFQTIIDQVQSKTTPTFDTAVAHQNGNKSVWLGQVGKSEAKVACVNGKSVVTARFGYLGLIVATENDTRVQMVDWAKLAQWQTITDNNIETEVLYTADGKVQSFSHVNDDRLVVNTTEAKLVLNLAPLCEDGQDVKLLATDDEDNTFNFVGGQLDDTLDESVIPFVAYNAAADTTVTFRSANEVPKPMADAYYTQQAAA